VAAPARRDRPADVHYIDSTRLGELIAAHITVSAKVAG
jgi:hypothetical protein